MTRILCIACLAIAARCFAQTTKPATQPAELPALIAQLSSDEWKARDEAQKKIVALGEPVVARMKELAASSKDPEVKTRADDIVRQIAAADFTQPSLVTLHLRNAPAREAFESVYAQANAKLVTWPETDFWNRENNEPVTIDLDKVPFWTAMDALEQQTDLALRDFGTHAQLSKHMGEKRGPVSINGPFMVMADETFGRGRFERLKVFVEPRFRVLGHRREADITEATDVTGDPVTPRRMGIRNDFDQWGGNVFDVDMGLDPRHRIAHVKGSVRVSILTRQSKFELDNIAKANNVEKTVQGRRFMVNAMNPEPGSWFIVVIAYNTNPPMPGLQQMKPQLFDADGHALQLGGNGSGGGETRVDYTLEFHQGPQCGPPAKLVMEFPVEVKQIDVPFEFGHVQAPAAEPAAR